MPNFSTKTLKSLIISSVADFHWYYQSFSLSRTISLESYPSSFMLFSLYTIYIVPLLLPNHFTLSPQLCISQYLQALQHLPFSLTLYFVAYSLIFLSTFHLSTTVFPQPNFGHTHRIISKNPDIPLHYLIFCYSKFCTIN